MKSTTKIITVLFIAFILVQCNSQTGQAIGEAIIGTIKGGSYPSTMPDQIILNLTETPNTSIAVNWRTATNVKDGFVEYTESGHGPYFVENAKSIEAITNPYAATSHLANYHSAIMDGLSPGKKYVYRVGGGNNWSEWFQFSTPPTEANPFSFIYFGDAQNDVKSMWSRVIREAYANMPQAAFMLHAGDLINVSASDKEWKDWFEAGSFIHAMIPSMMTPGNHEYSRGNLSPQWQPQFNLPMNGPEGLEESCYYIDYKDLKIISLDSPAGLKRNEQLTKQKEWLAKVLAENTQKWIAITLHHPLYSTKPDRDHGSLRKAFKPLIDQYKVDIVMQGHDHAYGRGHNVVEGANDTENNTMYVVSVSGPKMYDISDAPWMTRNAKGIQLFQIITIENNVLKYEAYTAKGELFDAFDLIKGADKNEIVDKIP